VLLLKKIEKKKKELSRMVLFKLQEFPLKDLKKTKKEIEVVYPPKMFECLSDKPSSIDNNIFDQNVKEDELMINEYLKEEKELDLCFEYNKSNYSYLFTLLRSNPCLIIQLYNAHRSNVLPDIMSMKEKTSFIFQLFPPNFDETDSLIFYSKLVKLSLEHDFHFHKSDFFEMIFPISFGADSVKSFCNELYNRPSFKPLLSLSLMSQLLSKDIKMARMYFFLINEVKQSIKNWQLSSSAKNKSKGYVFFENLSKL
jgi:hypothetical protein